MAKQGSATLRGRFSPGTRVNLFEADGPHQLRPADGAEPVSTETVSKDGEVKFSGLEVGSRYFAQATTPGGPELVRLTGRASNDPNSVLEAAPVGYDRVRLADGSFVDEPPAQHQKQAVEGATWAGQHQVPKGTLQRTDTPRGTAYPISRREVERAEKQWRKQEPIDPVVEAVDGVQEPPAEAPARTAEAPGKRDAAPAKSTTAKKGA